MPNLYFQIVSFFLSLSLLVVFKLKVKVVNKETKIYYYLLVSSFIDSLLMSIIIYIGYTNPDSWILYPLNRLDYMMYLIWAWCFFLYMFNVTYSDREKVFSKYEKIVKYTGIVNFIAMLLIFSLKINLHNTREVMYAFGPAVSVVYGICGAYVLMIVTILGLNYKNLKDKKYLPVFMFAFMAVVLLVVRSINPGLLLIPLILSYIDLIMFFTMENPDLKMMKELSLAKDKAEKYSNDKATFLFNITQRIRNPLNEIEEISRELENEEDVEIIKRKANDICLASQKVQYIVKDALDISQVDAKKINIVETKYNLKKVIEESLLRLNMVIKDKPVKVYQTIAEDIPTELYGDAIKMKQIFNTLLLNSAEYTGEGTIECNISCIKVRDVCRIIIKIEDTGNGLPDEELSELFNKNNEIDLDSLDRSVVSFGTLKKIINLTGGTIMVNNNPGKGTEYSVVLDQKIVGQIDDTDKIINKYENVIDHHKQKVLLINEIETELNIWKKMFNSKDYYVVTSNDLDKIDKDLDIIFIDERITKNKTKTIIQKLREKTNHKIPIILVCESYNKEVLDKYISDGFTECILKPIKLKELNEVLERQVKNSHL